MAQAQGKVPPHLQGPVQLDKVLKWLDDNETKKPSKTASPVSEIIQQAKHLIKDPPKAKTAHLSSKPRAGRKRKGDKEAKACQLIKRKKRNV